LGAGHREVIDRAVHSQFADIPAWEKEGPDDKRIRGERQPFATHLQHGLIVEAVKIGISEPGEEKLLD
jgi:hypothetical protein